MMKSDRDREEWIIDLRRQVWGPNYRKLPFPMRLHMLISCGRFHSDLWWVHGGRAFAINRDGYKKHIMNVFFDEHKFRSLQTLLHKYGFRRVEAINNLFTDIIIYQHDQFQEGDLAGSRGIVRVKTSAKKDDNPSSSELEPMKLQLHEYTGGEYKDYVAETNQPVVH